MFNTKLKKRIEDLEKELDYQKRLNDAHYENNKKICKWLNKTHPNWDYV